MQPFLFPFLIDYLLLSSAVYGYLFADLDERLALRIGPDDESLRNVVVGLFLFNAGQVHLLYLSLRRLVGKLSDVRHLYLLNAFADGQINTVSFGRDLGAVLRVEGEKKEEVLESLGVNTEDNANFMSDEDIRKKLSGNLNTLRKWLDVTEAEPYVMNKIAEIASTMNLSMNKLQLLQERVPNFEFIK